MILSQKEKWTNERKDFEQTIFELVCKTYGVLCDFFLSHLKCVLNKIKKIYGYRTKCEPSEMRETLVTVFFVFVGAAFRFPLKLAISGVISFITLYQVNAVNFTSLTWILYLVLHVRVE